MLLGLGLGLPFLRSIPDSFSPLDISQLKVWLKGDAGVTLVGGEVDVWADQSGNFNNVSAPAAINRPTITTRNGKPVLVFTGSAGAKSLRNLTTELLRNLDAATIIVAGSCSDSSSSRQQVAIGTATNTARALVGYKPTGGSKLGASAAGRRNNADALSVEVGQSTLDTSWLNNYAVFNWNGAILTSYVNGVQSDILNPFQTAGITPNDGGGIAIGSNLTLTGGWHQGQIAEVLVYHKALSLAELSQVNTYLNSRWL